MEAASFFVLNKKNTYVCKEWKLNYKQNYRKTMQTTNKQPFLKFLFVIIGQILSIALMAQANLRFERLEMNDASFFAYISCFYQDSRGFMWFGSLSGLYMFDGYNTIHFQHNPNVPLSISDNKITRIIEDDKGNFWVGTQNGLNYFDFKHRTFKPYTDKVKSGIGIVGIRAIRQDKDKNTWVGTDEGLYCMDSASQKFNIFHQFKNSPTYGIKVSSHGIYVIKEGILYFKDYKLDSFSRIYMPEPQQSQKDFHVRLLFEDIHNILWISTSNGLFYMDSLNSNIYSIQQPIFKNGGMGTIFEKNKNELWIFKEGEFYLFNTQTLDYQKYSYNPLFPQGYPKNRLINAFYTQSNKILWTQTQEQEFYIVDMNKQRFQNVFVNLMDNIPNIPDLNEMYEYSPDNLLIRQKNGAGLLNINTGKIAPFIYKPDYNLEGWQKGIICFFEESKEKLWIGTGGGIFLFDKISKRFTNLETQIKGFDTFRKVIPRKIHRDRQGNLWVVTWYNGAFKVSFEKKSIQNYMNSEADGIGMRDNGRSILEAKNGTIWVGTRGGLAKYIPEVDSFKIYRNIPNNPHSMSENTAFCIYEDKNGILWIGTYGGGLNKFNVKTEKFKHYTTDNGLLDNNVFAILDDKSGNLWLMGYKGLSVFNPITEQFKTYKKSQGLINEKYEAFLYGKSNYSDRFFFGGNQGIDFFYPDSIQLSTFDPNIWLTDFKLFNASVPISKGEKDPGKFTLDEDIAFTKHLTLTYDQNVVTFEFAALDYSAPKNIQYAYQLEGFDIEWQYINTRRSATFTNLNPGDYTFKVKATNADGVWGTKNATLKLTVLAPWWRTWWFRILVFLSLAAIGIAFYSYRFNQLKEREKLNKRISEVKMEALRAQMNPHFIFNALTSINLFVLKNDTDTASYYLNKFSKLMRDVLDHSRSELITVEEEVNTLKLYVEIEKMRFRDNFNFIFDIDPNARMNEVKIPPLIIQPYVENAIWHGLKHKKEGDALLKIKVFEDAEFFYIIVEDNGIGRQKALDIKNANATQHKSHGLNLTEERIKYYNETYFVQSSLATIDLKDANQNAIGTQILFKIKI